MTEASPRVRVAASACASACTPVRCRDGNGIGSKAACSLSVRPCQNMTYILVSMVRTLRTRLEELEGSEMSPAFLLNHNVPQAQPAGRAHGSDPHASRLDRTSKRKRLRTELLDERPAEPNSRAKTSAWSSESIVPATIGTWIKSVEQPQEDARPGSTLPQVNAANSQSISLPSRSCSCMECLDTYCCDMPLRRQADAYVAVFFGRHNRMFPVLHEPTFMRQYEWLWTSDSHQKQQCMGFCVRQSGMRLFLALVNAVFALGALWVGEASQHSISKAETFLSKVWQTDLLTLLVDEPGLEPIQIGILMSLHLQSMEKFSRCWNVLGLTVRIAQSKGLHLSAIEARRRGLLEGNATQLQREMRARIWGVCLLLDMYVSPHSYSISHVPIGLTFSKRDIAVVRSTLFDCGRFRKHTLAKRDR